MFSNYDLVLKYYFKKLFVSIGYFIGFLILSLIFKDELSLKWFIFFSLASIFCAFYNIKIERSDSLELPEKDNDTETPVEDPNMVINNLPLTGTVKIIQSHTTDYDFKTENLNEKKVVKKPRKPRTPKTEV